MLCLSGWWRLPCHVSCGALCMLLLLPAFSVWRVVPCVCPKLKIICQYVRVSSFKADSWFDCSSGTFPINQRTTRADQSFPSIRVLRVDLQQASCLIPSLFAGRRIVIQLIALLLVYASETFPSTFRDCLKSKSKRTQAFCVAHEGVKKFGQTKEEKRKERNLALVQRSSEDHLSPELIYEAVFHKVCLNSNFFGSLVSLWAITTFFSLHSSLLSALTGYWAFISSDTETGCFYLVWQSQLLNLQTCPNTGSSRFLGVRYPLQCATFSCYLLLLLAGSPLYRGGSSPLWSPSAPALLNPFLQNKDLVLFHSARSWITPWAVRNLSVRFFRVNKMKLGSRLPLTWLMGALTSIPWRVGLIHQSDALLQAFY